MYKRAWMLARLLRVLEVQVVDKPVEICTSIDYGSKSTGLKRTELYKNAKGRYVCSIDDDDMVDSEYTSLILNAIQSDPDAISINGWMTTNGRLKRTFNISKDNPYEAVKGTTTDVHYLRYHNHLSPIKREIAVQFPFIDAYEYEDYDFATRIHESGLIKTEVKIEKPIYHYMFMTNKK